MNPPQELTKWQIPFQMTLSASCLDALKPILWPVRRALERPEPMDQRWVNLARRQVLFRKFFAAAVNDAKRRIQTTSEQATSLENQLAEQFELLILQRIEHALTGYNRQRAPDGMPADTRGRKRLPRADLEALRTIPLTIKHVVDLLELAAAGAQDNVAGLLRFAAATVRNANAKFSSLEAFA